MSIMRAALTERDKDKTRPYYYRIVEHLHARGLISDEAMKEIFVMSLKIAHGLEFQQNNPSIDWTCIDEAISNTSYFRRQTV